MPEHVNLTDPELHEPKGVAAASANETYVADGAGSGAWSEPEPKGISAATSGQVLVADGAGSGAWTTQTSIDLYQNNISNGANSTSCTAGVDTTVPLLGNGANNFSSPNVGTGLLEFDATYNSSQGGIILDNLPTHTDIELRVTFTNTTGGAAEAIVKAFLVENKAVPGTGFTIDSSPYNAGVGVPQTAILKFYRGDDEAVYLRINSDATKNYNISGCYATAIARS